MPSRVVRGGLGHQTRHSCGSRTRRRAGGDDLELTLVRADLGIGGRVAGAGDGDQRNFQLHAGQTQLQGGHGLAVRKAAPGAWGVRWTLRRSAYLL